MAYAITLHLLAVVIWVGGMFFAYMALRPVAARVLEPPQRLTLWVETFSRFFPWVWLSVVALPITGYWMTFAVFGGFAGVGLYVHIMQALGWIMIFIYTFVYFVPYKRLRHCVAAKEFPVAGGHLATIRRLIALNLTLGIVVILVASVGRYFYA